MVFGSKKNKNDVKNSVQNNELYVQAQRSLVASLIYDGSRVKEVFEICKPEYFSEPEYELIIEAMAELSRRDEILSTVSVAKELESRGQLKEVGGTAELYSLKNEGISVILKAPPITYAKLVKEQSAKNSAKNIILENQELFNEDSGMNARDAISEVKSQFEDVMSNLADNSSIIDVEQYVLKYNEELDKRLEISIENEKKSNGLQGIPSMLPTLNSYTNGWKPEQLITVGARTGVGKSIFAIMAAVSAAQAGKSVMFFSLEMSESDIIDRIISCISGVVLDKLKSGRLNDYDKQKINEAIDELRDMHITIDTDPKATVDTIRSKASKANESKAGLDMIILDYLQLLTPVGKSDNRQQDVANMSRDMKLMAKTFKVPIMILVQLNRAKNDEEDDKLPRLDDIRESAAIAQDSDVVVLLHRSTSKDETTPHTLVILDKNRSGASKKTIVCHSNLANSNFREITKEKNVSDDLSDESVEQLDELLSNSDDLDDLDDLDYDLDDDFSDELDF